MPAYSGRGLGSGGVSVEDPAEMRGVRTLHPTSGETTERLDEFEGTIRAERLFMSSWTLRATVLFVSLSSAGCGGEILFGQSRSSDGSLTPTDTGSTDRGNQMPPDLGVADMGMMMTPDGGVDGGCIQVIPAAWPFARDELTYRQKFWDFANTAQPLPCNNTACHGGTSADKILIPATQAEIAANLNAAIDSLFTDMRPSAQPPNGIIDSSILFRHNPAGSNIVPAYSGNQLPLMQALVDSAKVCQ